MRHFKWSLITTHIQPCVVSRGSHCRGMMSCKSCQKKWTLYLLIDLLCHSESLVVTELLNILLLKIAVFFNLACCPSLKECATIFLRKVWILHLFHVGWVLLFVDEWAFINHVLNLWTKLIIYVNFLMTLSLIGRKIIASVQVLLVYARVAQRTLIKMALVESLIYLSHEIVMVVLFHPLPLLTKETLFNSRQMKSLADLRLILSVNVWVNSHSWVLLFWKKFSSITIRFLHWPLLMLLLIHLLDRTLICYVEDLYNV